MSYITKPSYIETIKWKYPSMDIYAEGDTWDDLNWNGLGALAMVQVDIDQIEHMKYLITQRIRVDATKERFRHTTMVLGTDDPEQIRTYEEKYEEAKRFAADSLTYTPIMTAEVSHTGESVAGLAPMVVAQYEAAKAALRVMFGNVEGERRRSLYIVGLMTTIEQLEAYTGPSWT